MAGEHIEVEREARERIMSVQFGRWSLESQSLAMDYIEKVSASLAPYGPDSSESYSKGGVTILYRAFHTTKESRRENQPHISSSGAVITWDGRLDNRAELIAELRDSLTVSSTDIAIAAAAYEKWGANCFAKLIGDWALSIWNPREGCLLLAKDPIGTKHLYYSFDDKQITWSTILDPLVLFSGKAFEICEEYIAGWFAIMFPAAHLTPYVGIHSVPPSSFVLLRSARDGVRRTVNKYWDFDPGKRIRYRTDAEYEEHFRTALAAAVQRRLRSDRPILAELSGGMDSSSIVCMADIVIARGENEAPRLDTISWYDDSFDQIEPDTNELHWITKVEEQRRSTGCHINLGRLRQRVDAQKTFRSDFERDHFPAIPIPNTHPELFKEYAAYVKSRGHLVTLSGIGGEAATGGGVPTPTPELQNLLGRARFHILACQLKLWAAKMRKSQLSLLWEAVRGFLPPMLASVSEKMRLVSWFDPAFVGRNRAALYGYPSRIKLFHPLPSFQHHICTLDSARGFLEHWLLQPEMLREVRFPYLDRSLLEFIYAIPQEQIVRVGQRRSLMKRALVGIVPSELLNRKRKAFVSPTIKEDPSKDWANLAEIGRESFTSLTGIIDRERVLVALRNALGNQEIPVGNLKRTLMLESWLRYRTIQGILRNPMSTKTRNYSSLCEGRDLQAPTQAKSSTS